MNDFFAVFEFEGLLKVSEFLLNGMVFWVISVEIYEFFDIC